MVSSAEKLRNRGWRNQIVESLSRLFDGTVQSNLYGPAHAQDVENAVLEILASPEHKAHTNEIDMPVLQSAALLHDAGFARRIDGWTLDQVEHIEIGKNLASQVLQRNTEFQDSPNRINQVLWLIEHHDDTTYSFPSATYNDYPVLPDRARQQSRADPSLAILQEADSLNHTKDACVSEVVQEWLARGVPLVADFGASMATWRWMDSAVGNIRLLGKRAVVDARSQGGNLAALEAYRRLEDYVREQCDLAGVPYESEVCSPTMRQASIHRLGNRSFELQIIAFRAWDELERILRSVPLLYDRSVYPYQHAMIQHRSVDLNALSPMALYTLHNRLEEVLELHDALMITYCLGLWDLPGLLGFRYNSEEMQWIVPPIVEEYTETMHSDHRRLLGLVDGLHRCRAARNAGLSRVRAVVASGVPYPLAPLPASWSEVRTYQEHDPPPRHLKRRYRYQALTDFPSEAYLTLTTVTADNYQYFFYRDLSILGSRGKRDFHEFESSRAH